MILVIWISKELRTNFPIGGESKNGKELESRWPAQGTYRLLGTE